MTTYRTLFTGTLVQDSFLSTGGTDDPFSTVDSPLARDGQNRPILRGTSLAGALIATLRATLRHEHEGVGNKTDPADVVPTYISGYGKQRQPSVWRFFNSHVKSDGALLQSRQHVAINGKTGAAEDSALFNLETLSVGTKWNFLLEVDTSVCPEAAELARKALAHWVAGRCYLGREVSRGLGWLHLEALKEYRLTPDDADAWPNSANSANYENYIMDRFGERVVDLSSLQPPAAPRGIQEFTLSVRVGEHPDGYGIDSLSIGGHAEELFAAEWSDRYLAPDGMTPKACRESFDPDFTLTTYVPGPSHESDNVRNCQRTRLPYIPGSSIRGPLRHTLERLLRTAGESTDLADSLFGTTSSSGKLLICDAFPPSESHADIQLAWLQQHAEDEFTGGVYGSGKFDRVAVFNGTFRFKMVLEYATGEETEWLQTLLKLAAQGQIPIGGGQWRGHGWLTWQVTSAATGGVNL